MASTEQVHVEVRSKTKNKENDDGFIETEMNKLSVENNIISSDSEKDEGNLNEEIANAELEITKLKSHMLHINSKLLPRERKLCLKKEEVALDISKYFSDLRQQINRLLLQEESKLLNELSEVVEKENASFSEETKCCKSLLEGLDEKEVSLYAIDVDDGTSENFGALLNIKKHLRDYKQVAQKLDEISEAPVELKFKVNSSLIDKVKDHNFGNIESIHSVLPLDVLNEEANSPELESESCHIYDGQEEELVESVEDNSPLVAELDSESTHTEDEESLNQEVLGQNRREDSSDYPTQDLAGGRHQENSSTVTETRSRQYEIPDEPPPPYPGLPENFYMNQSQSYMPQYGAYSHSVPLPAYGYSPRNPNTPIPSAPPATQSYDYRSRRSQEYIPPSSPSHSNQIEGVENLFNMSVISRVNSASFGYDRRKPGIAGICWVDPSFLLIADRWNCCVKLVHQSSGTYRILSFQNFEPWDIARVEANTSIVTLPKARKLYTIHHSNGSMSIKSTIQTAKGYSGITFCKSVSLYVGAVCPQFGTPCVELLDMRGLIQVNFNLDRYENPLFAYPRSVAVVDDNIIAVSDYKKSSVIFLRMDGEQIGSYSCSQHGFKLKDPQGMSSYDDHKLLFVVDSQQNAIHTLSSTGENKGVFKDRENMADPKRVSLWSDGGPLKLAVALGSGYITTFRLEELYECV